MDTDSFIIYIETKDFYKDIANDVEKWFDTCNYNKNDERPLPIGKNKKVFGTFKDELGGMIMKEFQPRHMHFCQMMIVKRKGLRAQRNA